MSVQIIDTKQTGSRIKEMCKERNISPNELKERMQFTSVTPIYKWWEGKSVPSLDNLVILAKVLETSIESLLVTYEVEV